MLLTGASGQKAVDSAYLVALTTKQNSSWMPAVQLNNKEVRFKLDTGAEVIEISQETHRLLGNPKLFRPTKILRGPSHQPLEVLGQLKGELIAKTEQPNRLSMSSTA